MGAAELPGLKSWSKTASGFVPENRIMTVTSLLVLAPLLQDPSWNLLPSRRPEVRQAAFEAAMDSKDQRWLSPLVDLLAFAQTAEEWYRILDAAGGILGEDLRSMEKPWRNLTLRLATIDPLPSFRDGMGWKRELLVERVDPRFAEFFRPGTPRRIGMDEIVWGGVAVEGIPSLLDPKTVPAEEADFLQDNEPVFGVYLNGSARAYPQRILDWHEMANDIVGDVPVALTYCTLCGAAVLYDRRTDDRTFGFRTSGLLQRSNKLMFDIQTNSLWNQLTGEPVVGSLARSGLRLTVLPIVTTSWAAWKREHPETDVVALDTGYNKDYRAGAAYGDYFRSLSTRFPAAGTREKDAFEDKERLVVIRLGTRVRAFSVKSLTGSKIHNREVFGEPVVLLVSETSGPDEVWPGWGPEPLPASVRAYRRGEHTFSSNAQGELVDSHGQVWESNEEALIGPNGQRLERLPSHGLFGFAWHSFYAKGAAATED